MKKELLDKWVAALRSGEYTQKCGALRNDVGYCSLGVLLDLVDPRGWMPRDTAGLRLHKMTIGQMFLNSTRIKLGLSVIQYRALIRMNDKERKSFPDIADYIEANIPVTP